MSDWLIILGMVVVTYSVRLSVIVLLGDTAMPVLLRRALRYVPPAALSAIVFPALFMPNDTLDLSPDNTRLLAGLVAAVIAWRSRSALLSIAGGMVLLWGLNALLH